MGVRVRDATERSFEIVQFSTSVTSSRRGVRHALAPVLSSPREVDDADTVAHAYEVSAVQEIAVNDTGFVELVG